MKKHHSPAFPISESITYILLSLTPGPKHGYAILKDVEDLSEREVQLSVSTLYESLGRLLQEGLIERVEENPEKVTRRPRKVYRLSSSGRQALAAEIHRMQALVARAQQRLQPEDA